MAGKKLSSGRGEVERVDSEIQWNFSTNYFTQSSLRFLKPTPVQDFVSATVEATNENESHK